MVSQTYLSTTTLPASLILTPRELKQYRRFQAQTTTLKPKEQGFLPSAAAYADFQSWLVKRDSGYLSDTPLADIVSYMDRAAEPKDEEGKARICRHTLHPTNKDQLDRCPVCTVEMHMVYMKALTVALEDAGGLVKQRWEAADRECPALQAWYTGKLEFVKDIYWLESLAVDEHEYNSQHHHPNQSLNHLDTDVKTAAQALELYWNSIEASPAMLQPPQGKVVCRVMFSPETSFTPGRDQHYFWRKSPRYEPAGKYAVSSDCDEEKDDHQSSDTENVGSKHLVTSDTHEAFSCRANTDEEQPGGEISGRDSDEDEDEDDDEEDEENEDDDYEDDVEDDDYEDDVENDDQIDADYIVFEYEEIVVQGAEFVVFED